MAKRKEEKKINLFGMQLKLDYLLGAVLVLLLVGYGFTKIPLLGVVSLIILLILFLKDVLPSSSDSKSMLVSMKELVVALVAALALWYGMGFLLQTDTPINVITSCSMLPSYDRGDLIFLQGGAVNAKEITITKPIDLADFVNEDCTVKEIATGIMRKGSCTYALKANNQTVEFDESGDVVVYDPKNPLRDYGLIVHRAVLKVNYKNATYYLIKGDNNPQQDVPVISPDLAKQEQLKGKVILRIPWVGYLKLFLSLQFDEPTNCKLLVERKKAE